MIEQLKRLRRLWGWSQAFVAEMLRVSRSSVSRWERGAVEPSTPNQEKVDALLTVLEKAGTGSDDPPEVDIVTGDRIAGNKVIQGDAAGRDVITTGDGTAYLIRDSVVIIVADAAVVRQLLGEKSA